MTPSAPVWVLTVLIIVGLLAYDFFFHVRKPHVPTLRESAIWSAVYVGIAILFGIGVLVFGGAQMGSEYFAGYITEKALSVDNLFVFLIIMASFRVPREEQQKVLLGRHRLRPCRAHRVHLSLTVRPRTAAAHRASTHGSPRYLLRRLPSAP